MPKKIARITFRNDRLGRRAGVTIKAGAAAILAIGLFASSPHTNEARAIDISSTPNAVNASLVFSPAYIFAGTGAVLTCARNYSANDVGVIFVIQRLDETPQSI